MLTPQSSRFVRARSVGLALVAGALALAACDKSLPSAPEIERMDVAAAEAGAQKVGIGSLSDDPNTVYTIDGREASADEARAIDASRIATIDIRASGIEGDVKTRRTIRIWTPEGLKVRGVEDANGGVRMKIVSTEEGSENQALTTVDIRDGERFVDGKRIESRKFEGLFVIDGKIEDPSSMRKLDPESIESIEVVKGPAASQLYSDPAAKNGVILITTKRPAGSNR